MIIRPGPALVSAIALLTTASTAAANTCNYVPTPKPTILDAMDDLMAACPPAMGACVGAIDLNAWPPWEIKCYGKKKKNGPAPDPDTLFQICSITKTMTATLFALRILDGTVNMFEPLDHFTGWPDTHGITLFELATHHSGLAREPWYYYAIPTTVGQLYDDANLCVNDPTGCYATAGTFSYSNFGFSVLGHALGDADGMTWSNDNFQNVMTPLNMWSTKPHEKLESQNPGAWENRATGYIPDSKGNLVLPASQYLADWPVANPTGGLWSTANDMFHWLLFNMGYTSGSADLDDARDLAQSPHDDGVPPNGEIGFAWNRSPDPTLGTTRISKPGTCSATGFYSHIAFAEGDDRGAFILFNSSVDDYQTMTNDLLYSLP